MKKLYFALGIIGVVLWITMWLAIYGALAFVAWHFITKFW